MSDVSFNLKSLSDQVRDRLLADPFFAAIPALSGAAVVLSEDPHDIVTGITAALNNIGLGVLVLLPIARVKAPNLPGPYFDDMVVTVKVYENPTINRSVNGGLNPSCYDAAATICALLHQFTPAGVDEAFYVQDCTPVADEDYIIYQVTVSTAAGLVYTLPKLAPVTADVTTPGNQTVTLACATPGAAIWYTLNGNYPAPRSPGARLCLLQTASLLTTEGGAVIYSESGQPLLQDNATPTNYPISVTAGQRLRARAWLDGYDPSTPAELNLQY